MRYTWNVKISDIKVQKRNRHRYSVFVDGRFSFSLDENTLQREGIHIGRSIEQREIDGMVLKDEFFRARDYGYLLLSYRDRSEREFRKRLMGKGFHPDVVGEVLAYFIDQGLVDDRAFTEKWIDGVLLGRPMGGMRIRRELRAKLVDDDIIDEAISSKLDRDTEYRLACRAAEKKLRALEGYETGTAKRRFLRYLQGRGFPFDIIHELVKEHFGDDVG
jgi:regulatory protein